MRTYVMLTGLLFGLLVVAHVWRMAVEPRLATDPGYILITTASAALGLWAWSVLRRSGRSSGRQ